MPDGAHVPVLLDEALSALAIRPDGVYVDATFGRGGHARAILARLGATGRLVALDRDPDAEQSARAIEDSRFLFRRCWFSEFSEVLAALGIDRVDGFLLDLGISSPQIDDPARGFSFRADGPLDMRMDPARGESAAAFLARATPREITEVIRDYGEERFAQSIARAIVAARSVAPVQRTRQLAAIVAQAVGARPRGDRGQDPATRTFQALRIFVNRELTELALTLPRVVPWDAHGRQDRRDQLPFAGGSNRQALFRRGVETVRRRSAARKAADPRRRDAGDAADANRPRSPSFRARDRREPARAKRDAARRRADVAPGAVEFRRSRAALRKTWSG
jgi:16S rRNA (cytosine1402-N4)-methyltransferase